ncbi:hypothetical protein PSTT_12585 [Puccinia striiformis]|uniref:No apical meristem-associated C-terminal domain-containing protein n=2 Tax=Puccinia striiformis TaxID=27350 RepID=A0A0L0VIK1_9BASI|nr:hypothetical protein PSTG_07594 [Puccinia striiformis f. sp. tritici PST-78]POW01261.1 hypothetical protein PSTT_12585 [Puccinia striiformis]
MSWSSVPNGTPTVVKLLKKKRPERNAPEFSTTTIEPCRVPPCHRLLGQIQFPPMLAQTSKSLQLIVKTAQTNTKIAIMNKNLDDCSELVRRYYKARQKAIIDALEFQGN